MADSTGLIPLEERDEEWRPLDIAVAPQRLAEDQKRERSRKNRARVMSEIAADLAPILALYSDDAADIAIAIAAGKVRNVTVTW